MPSKKRPGQPRRPHPGGGIQEDPTRRPRRLLFARIIITIVSLVVFWTLFEFGVRLAHPDLSVPQAKQHFRFTLDFESGLPHHRRDPVLGWRLAPGQYGGTTINELGFRGPAFSQAKKPGLKRIAHLGDSCTMGFTIASDRDIYSSKLATLLTRWGSPSETMNFGVDGYSSYQGRILIGLVLTQFAPDYVTLYFGYNDHHYSNMSDLQSRLHNKWLETVLERSHAYRLLRRQGRLLFGREARLAKPTRRVNPDEFEANLRNMVEQTRSQAATPILITTPLRPRIPMIENEVPATIDGRTQWVTQDWWVREQLRRRGFQDERAAPSGERLRLLQEAVIQYPEWPYLYYCLAQELEVRGDSTAAAAAYARAAATDAERQVMNEYNERVRRIGDELGVAVLDLEPIFAASRDVPLFNDVVHPNKLGHEIIARALAELIQKIEADTSPHNSEQGVD